MMAERAREGAEISVMRRRLMKSGLIWALSTSTAAVLTTLLFLSALPYTALPIAIQARVEQFAAATARLNELNSQTEDAQRKLDRLSSTQWDMEALSYVKPLLGQIKESPRAIYLKVPSKLESMPGPDDNTTWIRIR